MIAVILLSGMSSINSQYTVKRDNPLQIVYHSLKTFKREVYDGGQITLTCPAKGETKVKNIFIY